MLNSLFSYQGAVIKEQGAGENTAEGEKIPFTTPHTPHPSLYTTHYSLLTQNIAAEIFLFKLEFLNNEG